MYCWVIIERVISVWECPSSTMMMLFGLLSTFDDIVLLFFGGGRIKYVRAYARAQCRGFVGLAKYRSCDWKVRY